MTFPLDSHTTTDVKPERYQVSKPKMEFHKYDIRGIGHAHTNRKDDIFVQRRLYIDKAHMALDIFRFTESFLPVLS